MGASNSKLSAPFYLILSSSDQTYNGTALEPCSFNSGKHIGLCAYGAIANSSTPSFVFDKISSSAFGTAQGTGYVQYLPSDGSTLQLDFFYNPISNVAFSQLVPPANETYNGLFVAFSGDSLVITTNFDDTHPTSATQGVVSYSRWQICTATSIGGTNTPTLNWQQGRSTAENPTCESVSVLKLMVEDS